MWGLVVLGHVEASIPLDAEQDGAPAEGPVDGVDGLGQPGIPFLGGRVGEQGADVGSLLLDPGEDDPAFLVAVSGAEEPAGRVGGGRDDGPVLLRPLREGMVDSSAGLRLILEIPLQSDPLRPLSS